MSVTSASHHVQAIIDLLEAATDNEWTPATTPNVRRYWDDAQSERGPGADQPAILYVWSPTGTSLEQFSRDGQQYDKTDTVEVQAWSLDETEAEQLQINVTQILSKYLDDNKIRTPYATVKPTGQEDFREQKPARTTDHYVMSVEIDTRGLSDAIDPRSTTFGMAFDSGFA